MSSNAISNAVSMRLRRAGLTLDDLLVRRSAKGAGIVIAIIAALLFASMTAKTQSALVASQTANAWTSRVAPAAQTSLDVFVADWQVTRATASDATTLQWSVSDIANATASLYALDATRVKVQRINLVKRDGRIAISAEVSP
jgi:hypothetical protein